MACLPALLASCSIILSWFRLGFRGLSPYSFGILFHHPFLVPARVPGLVSLLFSHPVPSSFSCFRLGFRGLPTYFFGILFYYNFLVPGLVPLLVWHLVPSSGRGLCSIVIFWLLLVPGSGSGACLPSSFSRMWVTQ